MVTRAAHPAPLVPIGRCPFRAVTARLVVALGVGFVCASLLSGRAGQAVEAVEAVGSPADVAAIRAAAAAYRAALAKGDEHAVKAAWTADGDIVDGWGRRLQPRDGGLLDGGPSAEAGLRPEYRVQESQIRFVTADVALEDGAVDVVLPGTTNPIEGWFSAVWVRSGDAWKLAGVRESERPVVADDDMLEDLDWLVGDWVLNAAGAEGKAGAAMEMRVRWDAGRTFLVRDARVPDVTGGGDAVEVHQRIGWDPLVRRIRSWSFSSDGSRGEATWFRDGGSWVVMQTAVLPDGRRETAVNIYTYDGGDRCAWRTLPDALDGDDGQPARSTWIRVQKKG
jgi:hypothetical protein